MNPAHEEEVTNILDFEESSEQVDENHILDFQELLARVDENLHAVIEWIHFLKSSSGEYENWIEIEQVRDFANTE